jgi:hypothetical protein
MTTPAKPTTETVLHFDPHPNAGPPGQRKAELPPWPADWYLRGPSARGAIGGAAVTVLREHPGKTARGDAGWLAHRVRERLMAWREAGDPGARLAIDELSSARLGGGLLLDEVCASLLAAGSLMQTLRRERQQLDNLIEQLAQMADPR